MSGSRYVYLKEEQEALKTGASGFLTVVLLCTRSTTGAIMTTLHFHVLFYTVLAMGMLVSFLVYYTLQSGRMELALGKDGDARQQNMKHKGKVLKNANAPKGANIKLCPMLSLIITLTV